MNITDVGHLTSDADEGEDKMEMAAQKTGMTIWQIADYYTSDFKRNLQELNIMPPAVWSKATDHIQEMIAFARTINEYTYLLDDGLYFDTSKVKDYGRMALLELEGQREGARVAVKEGKRNLADFAIWRFSPKDKQRLMEWYSPWGIGAPGWHLECSVMSLKYLGHHFDIHTGGIDHRQIHHCNEMAQNQAYLRNDQGGVNYWLHNEFLVFGQNKEKMSKSSNRFLRLQTLVDWGIHPLVYRYFSLMATYRAQLEFSTDALAGARRGLIRLLKSIEALKTEVSSHDWLAVVEEIKYSRGSSFQYMLDYLQSPFDSKERQWVEQLDAAISQDLNTPQVLALLAELLTAKELLPDNKLRLIAIYDLVLGLNLLHMKAEALNLRPAVSAVDAEKISQLLAERQQARKEKNFARSDEIRDYLIRQGVALKDTPTGTIWEWEPLFNEETTI
jgi:cysteinyl-tRNA synthetase